MMCRHILDLVVVLPDDDIHMKSTFEGSLESDHYCIKSYFNVSVSTPTIYRTVRNMAITDRPLFTAELSNFSEFLSVEKEKQYCGLLCTVLEKHAPPSQRKFRNHK